MQIILKYFSEFTPVQLRQLEALASLYHEWNARINVISRKDMEGLYEKHVLHSLSIAAVFDFKPGMDVVDIGTGGGFPGIPLAIYFPEVKFHLVDSIGKKLKVVDAIAASLQLKNISTEHKRAEEVKHRKFDFAVSRAVAPLKDLWKWSKPLLKKNHDLTLHVSPTDNEAANPANDPDIPRPGLICLKGGELANEIQESGTRPRVVEISELFDEEYFKLKYLLYVPRQG